MASNPPVAELASDLSSVAQQVEDHAAQIETLTAKVNEIKSAGSAVVAAGSSNADRAGGVETLLQEVVDFLHWMFPVGTGTSTRPPPGKPTAQLEADQAAEDQAAQAERDRATQDQASAEQARRDAGTAPVAAERSAPAGG